MTNLVIILTGGIFAIAAFIGLVDLFVHLICWSARSLRTPDALQERGNEAVQRPAHGMTA